MTFLDDLKEKRTIYAEMIDFCCDDYILNNDIINKLSQNDFYFDVFCGDYYEYYDNNGCEITNDEYNKLVDGNISCYEVEREIYQYYLINYNDACRLRDYTKELVLYNEDLDLYVLCVCHWGTSWDYVSSNWKDKEDEKEC